jgi:hypothetical protein
MPRQGVVAQRPAGQRNQPVEGFAMSTGCPCKNTRTRASGKNISAASGAAPRRRPGPTRSPSRRRSQPRCRPLPPPPGPRGRERPARTSAPRRHLPGRGTQALTPGIETRRAHALAAAELGHTQPAARSVREQCLPLPPAAPGRAEVAVHEGIPSPVANKGSHSPARPPGGKDAGSYRLPRYAVANVAPQRTGQFTPVLRLASAPRRRSANPET